jgi:hypothetical protein
MIAWPWVSRRALDLALAEGERLRAQNDQLLAHVTRMDRVEHGLGEVPKGKRPDREPFPDDLLEYCNQFDNPVIRKQMRDDLLRQRAKGQTWDDLRARIFAPPEETADGTA